MQDRILRIANKRNVDAEQGTKAILVLESVLGILDDLIEFLTVLTPVGVELDNTTLSIKRGEVIRVVHVIDPPHLFGRSRWYRGHR